MDGQAGRGLGMHSELLSLRKKGFRDSGGVLSRVRLFVTLWTAARHAPLSMEVSRQEQWSGLPFPPGDPGPGIPPGSLVSPPSAGGFFTTWEVLLT